jgi:hypothetical protein
MREEAGNASSAPWDAGADVAAGEGGRVEVSAEDAEDGRGDTPADEVFKS